MNNIANPETWTSELTWAAWFLAARKASQSDRHWSLLRRASLSNCSLHHPSTIVNASFRARIIIVSKSGNQGGETPWTAPWTRKHGVYRDSFISLKKIKKYETKGTLSFIFILSILITLKLSWLNMIDPLCPFSMKRKKYRAWSIERFRFRLSGMSKAFNHIWRLGWFSMRRWKGFSCSVLLVLL